MPTQANSERSINVSIDTQELPPSRRLQRRPVHNFAVKHQPWQIQPFAIAPVLPGDTLEGGLLQVRAVTDPIVHPLIGWWLEHYVFYVKLTDLADAAVFKNMMLSASSLGSNTFGNATNYPANTRMYRGSVSSQAGSAQPAVDVAHYDFVRACLAVVTDHYFRDEDEAATTFSGVRQINGVPLAHVLPAGRNTWMESLMIDGTEDTPSPVQGPQLVENQDAYLEYYDRMRMMQLSPMTWEEWLAEQGIRGETVADPDRPELLRYTRDWRYPANTVDPADGSVASAVSWTVKEDLSKRRFFKEPGFLLGVTVARPKVYFSKQTEAAVDSLMTSAFSWLPEAMRGRPELALKKFAYNRGPLAGLLGSSDNYWIDVRDLLSYGDQFVNFDLASAGEHLLALPAAGLTKNDQYYVTQAQIETFFTSGAATGVEAGRQVRQDGSLALTIKSKVEKLT